MTAPTPPGGGLAWPPHPHDPGPPPIGPITRTTRKRADLWDRVKFLILGVTVLAVFAWNEVSDNPLLPVSGAVRTVLRDKSWLVVVLVLELARQGSYLVAERSAGYNAFWSEKVFGRWNRRIARIDPWFRFRVARATKWAVALLLIGAVLGAVTGESMLVALFELPGTVFGAMPMILQYALILLFSVGQFAAIFWFLSRGGVEVYFPDDIKTRFDDVWGQDPVLDRVKESMVFLDRPEEIEERGGYVPGGILLWGPPGTGKGQPVSALVMTPTGSRRMGDLLPGDDVIGSDGMPTRVLEVHLLGERDLYRVGFSDGSSLLVTEDHLWQVTSRYGGTKVLETKALAGRLHESDGHARYSIPVTSPVQFASRELPLHPYVMGALLGDGTFRHHVGISSADEDVIRVVESLLPEGDGLVQKSDYDWSVIGGATRTILKELELFGRYSYEKHIPDDYLWSSERDRLLLLQGLMDTDGNVDTRGVVEFHSTSAALAEGVRHLVESLGGTCRMSTRTTRYTHAGQTRRGRPVHLVRMALPNDITPVTLPRKVVRIRPRTKYLPSRRMESIVPEGREEARCLRVAADDHLYVTERFIVTHNTLIAEAVAGETGKPFVFVDPGAFINMFIGVGVLKVKALFRKLRKLALRYGGVIVFFDEADTLGNRGGAVAGASREQQAIAHACNGPSYASPATRQRMLDWQLAEAAAAGERAEFVMGAGMGGGGGMGTLQALLTELSGLKKPRGFLNRTVRRAVGMKPKDPPKYRILTIMATNLPDVLDPALLRPGRIDRKYHVGYPSADGRERTFRGYLDKVSHELTGEQIRKLAVTTPYASGAAIKDYVNEALVIAIGDSRGTVTYQDVLKAKHLKSHGPADDWKYSDWESHATAVHEACHAVAMYLLKKRDAIDVATIERRGGTGGFVQPVPLEEQFAEWRTERDAEVMTFLASLAGERMLFDGQNSQGVGGDLAASTRFVIEMLGFHGMGDTVMSLGSTPGIVGRRPNFIIEDGADRRFFESELGHKVEAKLQELLARVAVLLEHNQHHVLAIAHALETHKTISGDDIVGIIEGAPGPIVDGARYHEPDARRLLVEYHEAVVRAMKDNGRVAMPLPVLNGYYPVDPSGLVAQPVVAAAPAAAWPPAASPSAPPPPLGVPRFLPPPPPPPYPGPPPTPPSLPPPPPPPPVPASPPPPFVPPVPVVLPPPVPAPPVPPHPAAPADDEADPEDTGTAPPPVPPPG